MSAFKIAKPSLLAFVMVIMAYTISLLVRFDTFTQQTGAQGLEASYHVLWTAETLERSSPKAHFFLPTVTLNPELGHVISWGRTVPTKAGSRIYTSFPPLGFLIPYGIGLLLPEGLSFTKLAIINSLIGLATAIVTGFLARAVFQTVSSERHNASIWAVFAMTACCYLFLREALVSHGAVYWPHSLSQLVFVGASWAAFRFFQGKRTIAEGTALFFACLTFPSLEWTGFIFNAGLILTLVLMPILASNSEYPSSVVKALQVNRRPILIVMAATAMSLGIMLIHFASVLGLEELLWAFHARASARASSPALVPNLAIGYVISFGALLPLALLAQYRLIRAGYLRSHPAVTGLLIVTTFPILENLLLMQHAVQFSFDRLALALPLLLVCTTLIAKEPVGQNKGVLLLALGLIISSNMYNFLADKASYADWGTAVQANNALMGQVRDDPLFACSTFAANMPVRGYLNRIFDKDILERATPADAVPVADLHKSCGIAMIRTRAVFQDLPRIEQVEFYDATGGLLRAYMSGDPAPKS